LEILSKVPFPITVISTTNKGVASARNTGILASKSEYVALLDSDDTWENNKISIQIAFLLENQLDLVYCSGQAIKNGAPTGEVYTAKYMGNCYKYYKKFPSRAIVLLGGSGALMKKSVLEQVGIFDINVPAPTEDWDFYRRFSMHGKIGFCEEILVNYRIHERNVSRKSLHGYDIGNRIAVRKMFIDDPKIKFIERRWIWSKYLYTISKSYIRENDLKNATRSMASITLPIV
jgi:glycosyltransferase involved in cell wall biosynthesis